MEFNSNLTNLFENFQKQKQYKKKAFDVNDDGKINSKDETQLSKIEKNLKKDRYLFDVNGDGKFNQADIDMFIKGDVNGDGKVTQEESQFVMTYKKELIKSFKAEKADFIIDTKAYLKGVAQYTITNNNKSSLPAPDGNTIKFTNKVSVVINSGENVIINSDGTVNITSKDGKTIKRYFKGGTLQYSITNNYSEASVPCKVNNTIKFSDSVSIKIHNGETAVINEDGTLTVTSAIKAKVSNCEITEEKLYDKDGKLLTSEIKIFRPKSNKTYVLPQTEGLNLSKITKVSSNEDGSFTVTSGDKKYVYSPVTSTTAKNTYKYLAQVSLTDTTVLNKDGTLTVTSAVKAIVSNCEITEEKLYDKDGKLLTNEIKVFRSKSNKAYVLPQTEDLDLTKITKVSINNDGSFTVIAGGKNYKYADYKINAYDGTGKIASQTIRKNSKTDFIVTYSAAYKTNHFAFNENNQWIEAERIYNDGSKKTYSRVFNEDKSYVTTEKRYNANGILTGTYIYTYDSSGKMIDHKQDETADTRFHLREFEYDEEGNLEYRTRTAYDKETGKKTEMKQYHFLNADETEAKIYLETYNDDGSVKSVITADYYVRKDENGCEYWLYIWSDGRVERWNYNELGIKTTITITYPPNAKGQCLQTVSEHNVVGEVVKKYKQTVNMVGNYIDENGNILK